jgi:4-hydroxy-tetrahydrodipicolinate synthase
MQANGDVDLSCLKQLVDWHVESATDGIVVTGTTGESSTLNLEEQLTVIRTVVEQAAGRIPVIAGTGSNATKKTIELTRLAMEQGVDACLLVTPYYNKPTQEGLYQHYRMVAEAVPIPQILYNVPGRTGCDLLPETVERLAAIGNIIGIKEGRVAQAREIIARCGTRLDVYSGDDATGLEVIAAGGKGVISVTANIAPMAMHELYQTALKGDKITAEKLAKRFAELNKQLFAESNPIPIKWVMHKMGLIPSGIRLPLTLLAPAYHEQVWAAVEQVGTIK